MILCVLCRVSVAVEEGRMFHVFVFSGDSLICTVVHTPLLFKLNVKLPPSKSWYTVPLFVQYMPFPFIFNFFILC